MMDFLTIRAAGLKFLPIAGKIINCLDFKWEELFELLEKLLFAREGKTF